MIVEGWETIVGGSETIIEGWETIIGGSETIVEGWETGVADCCDELPSSPALSPGEKGAGSPVPSPLGRGLG